VRSFLALGLVAIGAMLVQTTVLPWMPWMPVVPDLMLVLAVYVGVRHPGVGGAVGAFLLGYFLDAFSGTLLGVNAFALTAVYAGAHVIGRHLWMESGLPLMVVVVSPPPPPAVAGVAVATLVADRATVWPHVVRYGFIEAGAAAVVAPCVFGAVGTVKRSMGLA